MIPFASFSDHDVLIVLVVVIVIVLLFGGWSRFR